MSVQPSACKHAKPKTTIRSCGIRYEPQFLSRVFSLRDNVENPVLFQRNGESRLVNPAPAHNTYIFHWSEGPHGSRLAIPSPTASNNVNGQVRNCQHSNMTRSPLQSLLPWLYTFVVQCRWKTHSKTNGIEYRSRYYLDSCVVASIKREWWDERGWALLIYPLPSSWGILSTLIVFCSAYLDGCVFGRKFQVQSLFAFLY